jgi:hypothetical protein
VDQIDHKNEIGMSYVVRKIIFNHARILSFSAKNKTDMHADIIGTEIVLFVVIPDIGEINARFSVQHSHELKQKVTKPDGSDEGCKQQSNSDLFDRIDSREMSNRQN